MSKRVIAVLTLVCLAGTFTYAFAQPPGRQGRPGGPPPGMQNPLLRLLDTNQDGQLSAAEIDRAAAKLKELDTSADGTVTADELRSLMPQRRGMRGPAGPGGGRGAMSGNSPDEMFIKPPVPKTDAEQKILAAIRQMQQGERFRNVSTYDGRLLRLLAEAINAQTVVEIGTSTGESATWLALALRTTGGHLFTHEIDEGRAKIAAENFKRAGVDGMITIVMGDAHEKVKDYKDPIDMLFLDADKEGYIDYLEKLVPLIRPGGLIVAHNMNARQVDPDYLEEITTNPDFETLFLIREGTGVGVTMKKR
jgi:predicted O-methyltransferase YrrM